MTTSVSDIEGLLIGLDKLQRIGGLGYGAHETIGQTIVGLRAFAARVVELEARVADALDTRFCPECGCSACVAAQQAEVGQVRALSDTPATGAGDFQSRVAPWMQACFGPEISADRIERNHRFLEEALELVQANDCTESEAQQLVAYVYGRPKGEINQEVGGVMVTLAALCLAIGLDMHGAGETELARIWTKVETIRAKQAAKPKNSPLPATPQTEEP